MLFVLILCCFIIIGKFRHLPVVQDGEVTALLDITKCLYDAIARMERAAEKGNAIAAAVEGVERQWGNTDLGMVANLLSIVFLEDLVCILSFCYLWQCTFWYGCQSFEFCIFRGLIFNLISCLIYVVYIWGNAEIFYH